ncbi:MAG: leucine-rich repeat protein [Clostridia bacterium]|nr:leucine-rich repeat protein [Clostridia bacterium]
MKKTMRKIFPIIACILVLLIGLVACEINGDKSNVSNEKNLIAVRVEGSPIEVYVGEAFEAKNLTVHLDYDDGTTEAVKFTEEDLPEEYIPLLSIVGEHTVEMLYRGFDISFTIIVKEPPLLVRFFNCLDEIVKEEYVDYGASATAPTDEEMYVEGYHFTGQFDKDFSNVTENMDVYGIYEQLYTVKFYNAVNEVVKSVTVVSGAAAEAPNNEQMYVEGYHFTGEFDKDFSNVTENMDVHGIYEKLFKVEFFNGKSELISTQYAKLGEDATEPTEEQRAMEGYVWKSWDNSFTNIQKDTKVYGIYAKAYTIIYSSEDENKGTVSGNVASGSAIILGTNITLAAEAKEGYTFNGWYMSDELVSDEAEYSFTALAKNYTFVAKFDENEVENVAGLYDANDNLVASWETLVNIYGMDVVTDYTYSNLKTSTSSPYYILNNNAELNSGVKLVIDKSIEHIGAHAFADCDNLISVVIGEGVTSIGDSAFIFCTSLTSVKIGNGVTSIGDYAFRFCDSLLSLMIPNNVTNIGYYSFNQCNSLENITVDDNNISYKSIDGNLYKINRDSATLTLVQYAIGKTDTSFAIPYSVTSIDEGAFWGCTSLTSVTIGNGVMRIGEDAFYYCRSLTNATIPNSVTSIGGGAFYYCDSMTSVTVGDGVTSIGGGAFSNCNSLTSVYITDLARWCQISFEDSSANPLNAAKNLYLDGELVTKLIIPDNVISISDYAFHYCKSLTSVTISNSITNIGEAAFRFCTSLTSVTIGNSVKNIGTAAFLSCTSLTSITIPSSVTSIGYLAFGTCESLTNIIVDTGNSTHKSIDNNLYRINEDGKTLTLVQYAIGKQDTSFTIPDNVTNIGERAFYHCDYLRSITISNSVTSIAEEAFSFCYVLSSVTIPNSVIRIGKDAFYHCRFLTSVTIGNGVTNIGNNAFAYCDSLNNVYYTGTEEAWTAITIGTNNAPLTNATIHYNYTPEE